MKTEQDLIKLIEKVESRQLKNENKIDMAIKLNRSDKLFWQGAKAELDYLHLHLCKVLKKHQKRIK